MSNEPKAEEGIEDKREESNIAAAPDSTVSVEVGEASENTSSKVPRTGGVESSDAYGYALFKRHMRYDPISILFALLVFVGGLIGYITKQSVVSLIAGTIFAALLAAATFYEGARKNPYPLLVILFTLGAMMGYRAFAANKFMPSGLVAMLAFIMFSRHLYMVYLRYQDRKRARL